MVFKDVGDYSVAEHVRDNYSFYIYFCVYLFSFLLSFSFVFVVVFFSVVSESVG